MRLLFPALLLAASPAPARDTLGQFGRWGAFRDGTHCYAVSEPVKKDADGSVTLSSSPARGVRIQFHARLSRPAAADRAAVVRIGSSTIPLAARDRDAWAADNRTELRILAAIRNADSLAVSAIDARGRRFTDRYALAGGPSAVDAAMIGCITP